MLFIWIVTASLLETIVAFTGQLIIFFGSERIKKNIHYFVSFAVGTMLSVVFLDILPEALEILEPRTLFSYTLGGFLFFFLLARFLFWYHCHNGTCEVHKKTAGSMILVGDTLHNFIDGIIITLAFTADFRIGVITTFAVLLHEMPQEMGDFFVLLNSGFSKKKALFYNFIVALSTPIGAIITYFFVSNINGFMGPALGIIAGNFLYIAASDLVPELHAGHRKGSTTFLQFGLILLGIFLVYGSCLLIGE